MSAYQLKSPCLNIAILAEVHKEVAKASEASGVPMYEIASEAIALAANDPKLWKQLVDRLSIDRAVDRAVDRLTVKRSKQTTKNQRRAAIKTLNRL